MTEYDITQKILNILNTTYHNYDKAHEISLFLNCENWYIHILQTIEYMYTKKDINNDKIAEQIFKNFYTLPNIKL